MATTIPNIVKWSIVPQKGTTTFYDDMNTWLSETNTVIDSWNTALNATNTANQEFNEIYEQIRNADPQSGYSQAYIDEKYTKTLGTLADLRALNILYGSVWVSGYHTKDDGAFGSHKFRLKGVKTTEVDNGGTIIIVTVNTIDYVYELQYDGAVNVKWFGATGDGVTDDSTAVQVAIDDINILLDGYSVKLYFPSGVYKLTKPLLVNQKDGLLFQGDGKRSTILKASGSMIPVLNSEFTALNGTGTRGYTYNEPSMIIVSATRVVGSTNGYDATSYSTTGDRASWLLGFEGLTFEGETETTATDSLTVNAIYAPSIAHFHIEDCLFRYVKAGLATNDVYRGLIESCDVWNSYSFINHVTMDGNTAQGTSLTFENCGLSRTSKGFAFYGLSYSSFINCTVDNCSFDIESHYAYSFQNCLGTTLISCGCELDYNTTSNAPLVFYAKGTNSVNVQTCNFKVFNYDNTANNKLYNIDACYVTFNNCSLNGGNNATQYINAFNFSYVNFEKTYISSGSNAIYERVLGDNFTSINFDKNEEPFKTFYVGNSSVPLTASTTDKVPFAAISTNSADSTLTGFTTPSYRGLYRLTWSGSVTGGAVRWFVIRGGFTSTTTPYCYLDKTNTLEQTFNINAVCEIPPNTEVYIEYATDAGSPILKNGSIFTIERLSGNTTA